MPRRGLYRGVAHKKGYEPEKPGREEEYRYQQDRRHFNASYSNIPEGTSTPVTFILSMLLGLTPVGRKWPRTSPLGPIPILSNMKMACITIVLSSRPVFSHT